MSIETTLAERGDRYGSFEHHADIAQRLQDVMRVEAGWTALAADQRQALTVIADKIARMLNGDPSYRDNWHDIVGYAKLVDDRMARDERPLVEPAAAIDDESPRAMAIGQNGPSGEHYDETLAWPEGMNWYAVDRSGAAWFFELQPEMDAVEWMPIGGKYARRHLGGPGWECLRWKDTLVKRPD